MAGAAAPRVLLVGCAHLPTGDGDDAMMPAALAELGVAAEWAVWDDGSVDFAAADLVVLRAPWDYPERRTEFLDWCESVPALVNAAPAVRWNTDKAYLVELADKGVPVVPTELVAPGEPAAWPAGEFVVKPAVGAGSQDVKRFTPDRLDEAAEHVALLHATGRTAVVQPYQAAVGEEGETALVFVAGAYTHAFVKGPMLRPGAVIDNSGLYIAEQLRPEPEPAADRRRLAEDTLDAACGVLGIRRTDLLYARVDVLQGADGRPLLLELEIAEPSLGFRQTDAAAPLRFASAIRAFL
ncbi:hypothetical protein F0L68_15185 [Solihabitans fulvus]|uniref:ATP-grasp domain-containing protein n=1 Tax=Solihabitans fulvus TaxID=1892852 RepID=A0A5B2XDE0_9PSEU|nr:hypothetical protein [Solihabitans fulvus]KAA2261758.1 hypothetical protein F0L68_15185 [Solihabitans fulvus]